MSTVRVYGSGGGGASSPLLSGLLTGLLIAFGWILLVYFVHHPVGALAWGVGALLGVVIAKAARRPSRATGTLAALLTLGTILFAKVGVTAFALRPIVRDEIARNRDAVAALYLIEMLQERDGSPELQNEDVRFAMMEQAEDRAKAASRPERDRLVRRHTDRFLDQMGFGVLLLSVFGLLDLLWIGLGISTAWKLGQGIG